MAALVAVEEGEGALAVRGGAGAHLFAAMGPEELTGVGVEGEDAALAGDVSDYQDACGFGEAAEVAASGSGFPK